VNGGYQRISKEVAVTYSVEDTEKNHENLSQDSNLRS
jgi:hypothetical protein